MSDEAEPTKGKTWYERDYPVVAAAVSICQENRFNRAMTKDVALAA
ncbi:hypothetical protein [Rarobacter incanus]|nr:hypothetical protein [Rarobacter incanus]